MRPTSAHHYGVEKKKKGINYRLVAHFLTMEIKKVDALIAYTTLKIMCKRYMSQGTRGIICPNSISNIRPNYSKFSFPDGKSYAKTVMNVIK